MEHLIAVAGYLQSHVLAVIITLVVSYVIGFLWHGPLFGKMWMECNNLPMPKKEDMKFSMMLPGLSANLLKVIVQCAVLGRALQILQLNNIGDALIIATIICVPFTVLVILNSYAWSAKPMKLWLLDSAYELVSMWAMAAVLYWTL